MARAIKDPSLVSDVAPVDVMNPSRNEKPITTVDPAPVTVVRPVRRNADERWVVDVRREGPEIAPGVFRLNRFVEGAEYVDLLNNRRIQSVGRNVHDGRVEAASDARFENDPNWECLFPR